ncbi:Hypothetical protein PHPALM_13726 [Phytophthora palmivora]|uniref:Uncharacterized protein n=1 Tax=Phytophthora palmivora TaxID=4796 RepID=A0A2P4XWJ5_9STRA|nr:Hypothetical protein PHPALM_13726 [Phytophthora palmivora]
MYVKNGGLLRKNAQRGPDDEGRAATLRNMNEMLPPNKTKKTKHLRHISHGITKFAVAKSMPQLIDNTIVYLLCSGTNTAMFKWGQFYTALLLTEIRLIAVAILYLDHRLPHTQG